MFVGVLLLGSVAQQAIAGGETLEGKRAEAARLTTDLEEQAARIVELDRRHRQAQARLGDIENSVRQAEDGVRSALARQAEARRRLGVQAIDAYVRGGTFTFIGKLRAGSGIAQYDTYRQVAAGSERNVIESLRSAEEDLEARRRALELLSAKARAEADDIRSDRSDLEQAAAAQRARVAQVNGELASLIAAEQTRRAAAAADASAAARQLQTFSANRPASAAAAAPAAAPAPKPPSSKASGDAWACIRQLESGGNYSSPGGGAYQFQDRTWQSLGYSGSAQDAPPAVQDQAARELQARDGWKPWTTAPSCGLV